MKFWSPLLILLPLFAGPCCCDKGLFSYVLSGSAVDPVYGVSLESTVYAVDLALQHINNNSTLLPAINLTYEQVSFLECPGNGDLLEEALNGANFALMGFGCSGIPSSVILTEMFNITPVIHYTPTSPQALFNNSDSVGIGEQALFSLHPSAEAYAQALLAILQEFGWQRLAVVTSPGELFFNDVQQSLRALFEDANMTLLETTLNETIGGAEITLPGDSRIIFLNVNSASAMEVLCEVSRFPEEYSFPRYVWITYEGNYDTLVASRTLVCGQFLEGVWAIQPVVPDTTGDANNFISDLELSSVLSYFAFDSVLALAQAVNDTLAGWSNNSPDWSFCEVENSEKNTSLSKCFVRQKIQNLNMNGLMGEISFNSRGERAISLLGLHQYRGQEDAVNPLSELIATITVNASNESVVISELQLQIGENETTIFGGPVPPDGTPFKNVNHHPLALVIVYHILGSLGNIFAIVCFLFNIIFRKRKIVKLISPNLNYFVTLGAVLLYSEVYFRMHLDNSFLYAQIRCNLQSLFVCVGYTLCFAPVLMKMIRVYHIFHNPSPKKKPLKDWHLFLGTSIMVGIAVFLVVLGYVVPVFFSNPMLIPDEERPNGVTEDGITVNNCIYQCYGFTISLGWVALEYIYLLSLQVVAFVLAIITRKVKIKVLNDSKWIMIIVYTSTTIMIGLGIITFATGTRIILNEALFCGGIFLATTVFLVFIFVPKMVDLYQDPRGEGIFGRSGNTHSTATGPGQEKVATSNTLVDSNSYSISVKL